MLPNNPLVEYFGCPEALARVETDDRLSSEEGYFTFRGAMCYGRRSGSVPPAHLCTGLVDASPSAPRKGGQVRLPFELAEIVTNLRREQYQQNGFRLLNRVTAGSTAQRLYYFLRPVLRVGVRKHLQKIRLSGWEDISFPRWPVDVSVDVLMRDVLGLTLEQSAGARVPFIWFWPDGANCALMVTHDVEGASGIAFCERLMDIDDAHGIKSAFQLIPEGQEQAWQSLAPRLRRRGFEVNLHDLNHDGYLFHERAEFLERARRINHYARSFQCEGFRSGAMYRRQQWYDAFEFEYDMSVPNVAHLEPQRGGCCTVMPYFVGDILELPLTTIQDYSLFHILGEYSISLWQQQIETIREQNGLITVLAHPDYLALPGALEVYTQLLAHLQELRSKVPVWMALPAEINRWWRNRREMRIVRDGNGWRIEGPDAHRARLAYATLDDHAVHFDLAEHQRRGSVHLTNAPNLQ
jgi:hypothetical protein